MSEWIKRDGFEMIISLENLKQGYSFALNIDENTQAKLTYLETHYELALFDKSGEK